MCENYELEQYNLVRTEVLEVVPSQLINLALFYCRKFLSKVFRCNLCNFPANSAEGLLVCGMVLA